MKVLIDDHETYKIKGKKQIKSQYILNRHRKKQ